MSKMRMSPISLSLLVSTQQRGSKRFSTLLAAIVTSSVLQSGCLALRRWASQHFNPTGDKPDNGDHPFAQSVFEVDCMGLLNIAKTLNAGKDLAGNDLDAPTSFYIGATGNPGAQI